MQIVPENGRVKVFDKELDFYNISRGYIYFYVTDFSKFRYEKNYTTTQKRKLSKNYTINYQNVTLDLSSISGIK